MSCKEAIAFLCSMPKDSLWSGMRLSAPFFRFPACRISSFKYDVCWLYSSVAVRGGDAHPSSTMYELAVIGYIDRMFHSSYGFHIPWIQFIPVTVYNSAARSDFLGVKHRLFGWDVHVMFTAYVEDLFLVVKQLCFCFNVWGKIVYPRLNCIFHAIKQLWNHGLEIHRYMF